MLKKGYGGQDLGPPIVWGGEWMIELTKMNGDKFYINPNLVEIIEHTPDTLITTISGKKYYVLEKAGEVSNMIVTYYKRLHTRNRRTIL